MAMDMLSELPEELIHRILYFLPTREAARTTVLSKSWKRAWDSRPWDSRSRVFLNLSKFKDDKHKSLQLTRKSLESYIQHGIAVEDFTLSWNAFLLDDDNQIFDTMNQWIDFAFSSGNNLKQLVIKGACCYGKIHFGRGFPLDLRTSNTLTTLDLYKCKFAADTSESIKFPSLRNLTLRDMELNSAIINNTFLSGSPLLERLRLLGCAGLESLEVSGLVRLTSIAITDCIDLERVDIHAPNLRVFSFLGFGIFHCRNIKLAACDKSLKKLLLSKVEFPTDDEYWLQTTVSRFVSLKTLYLRHVYNFISDAAIEISSPSLRKLVLINCEGFNEDTVINAPKLRSVEFMDNGYPFYSLPKSNKLSRVQFSFSRRKNRRVNALSLHPLKEFFSKTNRIKDMSMTILCRKKQQEILIFHEDFSYLMLCKIMDNLENLNHDLEFIVEKSSLSSGPIGYSSNAFYIASSSSYNIDFIKEENVSRWKRNVRCRRYARDLKDMQSEKINLEQDIKIRGDIDAALLQAYQTLSYTLTRINLHYNNKRRV